VVEIDALLERARMPIDFKEAVSVAHFDHKPLLVENQGLQGHGTYFSLERARLGSNMALLWGANVLVPYFDYYQKKIAWPPQWFLSQPFWRYFHHYADYVRRVQFMNAQGRHIAPASRQSGPTDSKVRCAFLAPHARKLDEGRMLPVAVNHNVRGVRIRLELGKATAGDIHAHPVSCQQAHAGCA
jgi:hypothetical protein